LFCTTWWLEAVAPGRYQILTVERDNEIQAAWPFVIRNYKLAGRVISRPPLTPYLGILYRPEPASKLSHRLSHMKALTTKLVEQLPQFSVLTMIFHRNFDYWLPLYWLGFEQTTHYTYAFEDISKPDLLWAGLRKNISRDIRKAQSQGIVVERTEDIDEFWQVHKITHEQKGVPMPYDLEMVKRIDQACKARLARMILVAKDKEGDVNAAAYIVWDQKSAYYLMGGADPNKRKSGAASLVIWDAIRYASEVTHAFDFEGSIVESVERFFRAFGAQPYPCFVISKANSRLWYVYKIIRDIAWVKGKQLGPTTYNLLDRYLPND
jgi:hypothetical protein